MDDTRVNIRVLATMAYVSWDKGQSWWAISPCGTIMQRFQQPPNHAEEWEPVRTHPQKVINT